MVSDEKRAGQTGDGAPAAPDRQPVVTFVMLARHGENEWVSSGKLAGRTPGVHLNEKGRQEALALAEFLAIHPIDAIYSSPLERCLETAQPLGEALSLPVQVEPAILEVDYGEWHGIELKAAVQRPEWAMVQHYPSRFRFPEGEGLRQTQQRAVDGVERIVAEHPNAVVALFSHGDVIRTLLAHYAGVPLDLFQRIQVATGSVSTIAFFDSRPAIINMNVLPEPTPIKIKREPPQPVEEPVTETPAETPAETQH